MEYQDKISKIMSMRAISSYLHFYYIILCRGGSEKKDIEELQGVTIIGSQDEDNNYEMFQRQREARQWGDDSVRKFLHLKAYSNPVYMVTEFRSVSASNNCKDDYDPFRKALAIARFTELLSKYDTQYSQEYLEIMRRQEKFATDLLNECESSSDAATILQHAPFRDDIEDVDTTRQETWNIALWNNHKMLVSHPAFQNFLWEKLCGPDYNWNTFYFHQKVLNFVLSILIFFTYPIFVLIDTLFRSNDILFKSRVRNEKGIFRFYRKMIHRPIFRISTHLLLEFLFLVSVCFSTIDPFDIINSKDSWSYDVILCIFIFSFLLDDIVDLFRRGWATLSSFWHMYTLFTSVIFCVGQVILFVSFGHILPDSIDDRALYRGDHAVNIGATIFSIAATLTLLRPLRWLLFNRSLGPTVVCIIKVMRDAFHIFLIYLVILGAFTVGIFSMFKPFDPDFHNRTFTRITKAYDDSISSTESFSTEDLHLLENSLEFNSNNFTGSVFMETPTNASDSFAATTRTISNTTISYNMFRTDLVNRKGLLGAMFWRLFDPGQPDFVTVVRCDDTQENCEDDDFKENLKHHSLEFSHLMGQAMWAAYQGITVILLINILIAMMNTTYTRIWEQRDTEWKYSKSFYQVEFLDARAILPPPFRYENTQAFPGIFKDKVLF